MSFKVLFRVIVFLLMLFVLLYIGMNNRQAVDFNFPVLLDKKWTDQAGIVYFAMFAAGVLAGALLTAGGGKARGRSAAKGEK
jgi:uncharacterized integral membrane protein